MGYILEKILLFQNIVNSTITIRLFLFGLGAVVLYLFLVSETGFFKIIISILFLLVLGVLLARESLDFFAGFLLVGELPILVVSLLFYFHKYSLQFDNLYFLTPLNKFFKNFAYLLLLGTLCLVVSSFSYYRCGVENFFFEKGFNYTLIADLFLDHRNDALHYYSFYYVTDSYSTIAVAILIFIISYLVILIFISGKLAKYVAKIKKDNILFLRRQHMSKQAVYTSTLRFFSGRVSKKQHEANGRIWEEQLNQRKKAEAIIKKKVLDETKRCEEELAKQHAAAAEVKRQDEELTKQAMENIKKREGGVRLDD